jgi:hypothetical protein
MLQGNTAVVFMVIVVVSCVLGLAFGGLYCLNEAVKESDRGQS